MWDLWNGLAVAGQLSYTNYGYYGIFKPSDYDYGNYGLSLEEYGDLEYSGEVSVPEPPLNIKVMKMFAEGIAGRHQNVIFVPKHAPEAFNPSERG